MPGDLGAQCLKCRKRRVKCDSAQPGCQKCVKAGLECPGYVRKPAWTVQAASDIRKKQEQRKRKAPNNMTAVKVDSESSPSDSSCVLSSPLNQKSESTIFTPSNASKALASRAQRPQLPKLDIVPSLSRLDRESWRLIDSLMYFNHNVRPNIKLVPEYSPNSLVGLEEWRAAPSTLKHLFVFGMLQHRIITGESPPALQAELYYYRGLSFKQLAKLLEGSDLESTILAYLGVLVMLAIEIQINSTKFWYCHMDAVWQLTDRLDGVSNLWKWDFGLRSTVVMLFYMDVTSFTSTAAWQLSARRATGRFLRTENLENLEEFLFESPCPCPLDVLHLIADITDLRHSLCNRSSTFTPPESPGSQGPETFDEQLGIPKGPLEILQRLQAFDSENWATNMCRKYQPRLMTQDQSAPALARWVSSITTLAKCYQAAAIVYLLRSMQSCYVNASSLRDFEQLQDQITLQLPFYRDMLSLHLSVLQETLGHTTTPQPGTNLWRFVNWPLFIDAYECIAWNSELEACISVGPEADQDVIDGFTLLNVTPTAEIPKRDPAQVIARLRQIGRELGANSLLDGAKLLEGVQLGCKYVSGWSWDDAFEERCVFVL